MFFVLCSGKYVLLTPRFYLQAIWSDTLRRTLNQHHRIIRSKEVRAFPRSRHLPLQAIIIFPQQQEGNIQNIVDSRDQTTIFRKADF